MIAVEIYSRPESIAEALKMLASDEYMPIAGGTDIIPQLRRGHKTKLLDIGRLGLNFIRENGADSVEIGSAVTHCQLHSSEIIRHFLPLLAWAASLVGSAQIRNRGTVGGNIVNASPCADTVPALLNYDGELILLSAGGKRPVDLSEFISRPYVTTRRPDELLHSIICKKNKINSGPSYIKLGRRQAVNISRMTIAATLGIGESGIITGATIAAGSVFPVASRIPDVEKLLIGKCADAALFGEAAYLAADLMIKESGYRWSSPYKKPVLIALMIRALTAASKNTTTARAAHE